MPTPMQAPDDLLKVIQVAIDEAAARWQGDPTPMAGKVASQVVQPMAATATKTALGSETPPPDLAPAPTTTPSITMDEIATPTQEEPLASAMVGTPPALPADAPMPAPNTPESGEDWTPPPPPDSPVVPGPPAAPAETAVSPATKPTEAPSSSSETTQTVESVTDGLGLEDIMDPELLAQLRESASGKKMNLKQVIALAGLATTNPEMAQQIMASQENDKQSARQLLAQMGTQAAIYKRQMDARKQEIDRTTTTQNAMMIRQAMHDVRTVGATPEAFVGDYADTKAVQEYLTGLNEKHAGKLQGIKVMEELMPALDKLAQTGPAAGTLETAAVEMIVNQTGMSEEEARKAYKGRGALLESVATAARQERESEQRIAQTKLNIAQQNANTAQTDMQYGMIRARLAMEQNDRQSMMMAFQNMNETINSQTIELTAMRRLAAEAKDTETREIYHNAVLELTDALTQSRGMFADIQTQAAKMQSIAPEFVVRRSLDRMGLPGGSVHTAYQQATGNTALSDAEAFRQFTEDVTRGGEFTAPGTPAYNAILRVLGTALSEAGESPMGRRDMYDHFERVFEGETFPGSNDPLGPEIRQQALGMFDKRVN